MVEGFVEDFNPMLALVRENARGLLERDPTWAKKLPRQKRSQSYDKFTLFFHDHSKHPIGHIIDIESGKRFPYTDIRTIGQKSPPGAEAVFTAFPRQMYVLEAAQSDWVIYGRDHEGKARKVEIKTRGELPADPSQIHRDNPSQSLDQK